MDGVEIPPTTAMYQLDVNRLTELVLTTPRQVQEAGLEGPAPMGNAVLALERVIPTNAAHLLDSGTFCPRLLVEFASSTVSQAHRLYILT